MPSLLQRPVVASKKFASYPGTMLPGEIKSDDTIDRNLHELPPVRRTRRSRLQVRQEEDDDDYDDYDDEKKGVIRSRYVNCRVFETLTSQYPVMASPEIKDQTGPQNHSIPIFSPIQSLCLHRSLWTSAYRQCLQSPDHPSNRTTVQAACLQALLVPNLADHQNLLGLPARPPRPRHNRLFQPR
jgi:hypothetical protein